MILVILFWTSLAFGLDLQSGDVILEPLDCALCTLITHEEDTPYSHAGVILVSQGTNNVLESYPPVTEEISLSAFLARMPAGQTSLVLRSARPLSCGNEEQCSNAIENLFNAQFNGAPYDGYFSWTGPGMYCSKLVAKLLNPFLPSPLLPKPMHYNYDSAAWNKYFEDNFHKPAPVGQPGISPGDLQRSTLFTTIGTLSVNGS